MEPRQASQVPSQWQLLLQMMALNVGMSSGMDQQQVFGQTFPREDYNTAQPARGRKRSSPSEDEGSEDDARQQNTSQKRRSITDESKAVAEPASPVPKQGACNEATTPQVLQKLKSVVMSGDSWPSPKTMAHRMMTWAAQAQDTFLPKQVAAPKTLAITATECVNKLYHFTKDQAQEAGDAVQHFLQLLQAAKPSGKSGTYQKHQLEVIFRAPIEKAKILALKVQGFHGPSGPLVRVQLLEEEMGKPFKPNDRGPEWHATTKGDARLFVLALTIPPEEGTAKKPIKVSLQLRARTKELKVVADKDTLKRYAANFVMLFGKADQVNINKTGGAVDLSTFWE